MKTIFIRASLLLSLVVVAFALSAHAFAGDPPKSPHPDIYDESADGSKQIADALTLATKEGKNVLLQFGANWCGWCHKLHGLMDSDPAIASTLKANYVVVLIDVNEGRNKTVNEKYGNPVRFGLPVIVVLDSAGQQLTTKDSGELEEGDHHSPAKILAFLKQWSPKTKSSTN